MVKWEFMVDLVKYGMQSARRRPLQVPARRISKAGHIWHFLET